jgi:hypothetical protein
MLVLLVVILLLLFAFGMVAGPYYGVRVFLIEARALQYDLSHKTEDVLEFGSSIVFPVRRPRLVKGGSDYTIEVDVEDALERWANDSGITSTQHMTLSLEVDQGTIVGVETKSIGIKVAPGPTVDPGDSLEFSFSTRGDVDLEDEIFIDYILEIGPQTETASLSLPIHDEYEYFRDNLWKLVVFAVSSLLWILIVAVALAAFVDPVAAAVFLVVLLILAVVLVPSFKDVLEIVLPFIKTIVRDDATYTYCLTSVETPIVEVLLNDVVSFRHLIRTKA